MANFENAVKEAAEKAVLKIISEGQWIQPDYANRFKMPPEMLSEIWQMVDVTKLKVAMVKRIETELADRLINHLAAEMATDIKQLLSVRERREALRSIARTHIDAVLKL